RARRAREVEDVVDGLVDPDPVDDVLVDEREPVVAAVLDVLERAGLEVVDADDPVAAPEEVVAEMGAEEAGASGDDRRWHPRIVLTGQVSARRSADQRKTNVATRSRLRASSAQTVQSTSHGLPPYEYGWVSASAASSVPDA